MGIFSWLRDIYFPPSTTLHLRMKNIAYVTNGAGSLKKEFL